MSYAELSSKLKRVVERDVETLFSPRAFLRVTTIEDIKRLPPFHPSVKVKDRTIFLSDKGIGALRRLIRSLTDLPSLTSAVSTGEIDRQVQKSYNAWIERSLQPTGQEFVNDVVSSLHGEVKQYTYLVQIEGVDLKGQEFLPLGTFCIQRSNPALFDGIKFGGKLDRPTIYSRFQDSLWLIGCIKGSQDVVLEQFEYRAELIVGILGIYGAILFKGSIWRSRVRAVTSPLGHRKAISLLRWEMGGENPSVSRKWGREQDLLITAESVAYLSESCFLEELASLPDIQDRSELQDAIVRSIYWFAESYKDRTPIMQFVKLWTCVECFFTIDREKITELNAAGISTILTFAGYGIVDPKDYPEFKRRVKKMYALRSKAVHRAEFGHVETKDLDDLSHWTAWIVISMVALAESGYKTLRQVHKQTSRLDKLSSGHS